MKHLSNMTQEELQALTEDVIDYLIAKGFECPACLSNFIMSVGISTRTQQQNLKNRIMLARGEIVIPVDGNSTCH